MNCILFIAPLFIGWLLDLFFGDPAHLPHPVVYMGKWISFWEHRLNKGKHRKAKGAIVAVCSILLTYVFTCALLWFFCDLCLMLAGNSTLLSSILLLPDDLNLITSSPIIGGWDGCWLGCILVFFCLAGHTLRKEVKMVFKAVDSSLEEGRKQVARIVGRDTQELSAQEVRTAALETLAENLSDGVVAPLFWFMLLGVPGMMMYKMINTLDSMIGYHSPRYKDFGCWAARIDDVANYIPARITALLMLLAPLPRQEKGSGAASRLRFVFLYGPQHASPNSGWPEAALASILNCRFGGPHNYFGEVFHKPYIGENPKELTTKDMRISLRVCLVAECMAIVLCVAGRCLLYWLNAYM